MVAIVTGTGTGLERSSASLLGARGQVGSASFGRGSENVYVNAANGNLVVTRQDEFLLGLGPDVSVTRTHNSQRAGDSDNNDGWRMSFNRKIGGSIGAYGAAGSKVMLLSRDGSDTYFNWDSTQNAYVFTDGAGAHDTLTRSGTVWTWTDGNSRATELYDETKGNLITRETDADGNSLLYSYTPYNGISLNSRITVLNSAGVEVERVDATYDGTKLTQLVTTKADGTLTRVRYGYETYGNGTTTRLISVEVDLSPADNSTADGQKYSLTYTYVDTTSLRVASIAESDGSLLQIGYTANGAEYRVTSLTETVASGVTRVTGIFYDIANRKTRITDPLGGVTTMSYDASGNLTNLATTASTTSYTYNANGDVTSMTENGRRTDYEYDSRGNQTLSRDAAGNTVVRTYGLKNELLTSTRYLVADPDGAGALAAGTPVTTRYAYDGENHLRFEISAEGKVTEYRYDRFGQRVSVIAYRDAAYNLGSLAPADAISEAALNSWVSALADRSNVERTDTFYDFRGNVTSEASYASVSVFGEGLNSPLAITPGANTTVAQQSDGLFRITKTSGSLTQWDADAHSTLKSEGDFVLRLRPGQSNAHVVGGVSSAPGNSASYQNPDYGLYFIDNGVVYYMENGVHQSINATYVAGDNFWLTRVGSTISYYKGATLASAMAAGALRTRTGSVGALYFDSSLYTAGTSLDVEFTPQAIVVGVNTSVALQPDGMTRVTKTGGSGWDADARGTARADGDFVAHVRAVTTDNWVIAGVSRNPATIGSYNTVDFSFYFAPGNQLWAIENEGYQLLGSYQTGEDFWLTRVGTTINYYRGATLETAVAAGALRSVNGVTGSFYFDSAILVTGGAADVDFAPLPVINGVNTTVSQQPDGLLRVTKNTSTAWDGDARGTIRAPGDFVLQVRPGQSDKYAIGGVSANPGASASYDNLDFSLYFIPGGTVYYLENSSGLPISTYAAGDNFWLVRSGSTISYYKGATLEAAKAAGPLRTRTGVAGTFAFDSALHSAGSILDVSFDATVEVSRTNYVYSPSGELLSRVQGNGKSREVFFYDGLGRLVGTTDAGNATTTFLFDDAASKVTANFANGLSRVATYDKAGQLISVSESGPNVTTAVTAYAYDSLGRLRMETDPTGLTTYHLYDADSRKVADVRADGALTEYVYDSSSRLVKTVGYLNKLSTAQIALLDDFTAGGAGGAGLGGIGTLTGPVSLLTNGGFDTSGSYTATGWGRSNPTLPGWTRIAGEAYEQVVSGYSGINATEGAYWLDLDSYPGTTLIPIGSNVLVNGSFDTSDSGYTATGFGRSNPALPGWVKAGGDVYEQVNSGFAGVSATDGSYWLDLDSSAISSYLATGQNLLTNGGFEASSGQTALPTGISATSMPGWTKANPENFEQVYSGLMGVYATEGFNWLDLDSVATSYAPGGPNLVVNGSFEQSSASPTYAPSGDGYTLVQNSGSIPGWTALNFPSVEQNPSGVGGVAASDGSYWLDMEGGSSGGYLFLNQTITGLYSGQPLQLKFDHANRAASSTDQFKVFWNNVEIAIITPTGTTMVTETFEVTGQSGNNNLSFVGMGTSDTFGASIDNVRLYAMQPSGGGGNMDISQTVSGLAAGQIMQLQFNHANRTSAASGSFEVWWNNTLVATVTDTGTAMLTKTYNVTAIAGNNTVRFKSLGTVDATGASLDNVRLFATVPGPPGGNMDISQTVSVGSAGTMQLQFDHANRSSSASGSFDVYWNGGLVAQISSTGTAMATKTYQVSAVAGNNTLRFVGTGTVDGEGASIDNVRLFAMGVDPNSSNMHISQTVSGLTAGQGLLLQFDHANRTSAASGAFEVWWNDQLVATVAEAGTVMQTKSYNVTAAAGSNTLRFKSTGTGDSIGTSLDNVRLFLAPTYDVLAGLRPGAHADDRYQWNVYDSASRLIETIDGSGAVTTFAYDGASRQVQSQRFANRLAAATVEAYKSAGPTAMALPTIDALNDRVERMFYDKDGRLVGTLDGEGYLSEKVYDNAGLLIETIRYATPTNAADRAAGTFATLKATVVATVNAKDIHQWFVYDGRGLLRASIDGEGDLTRYHYTAAGYLDQEVRGQKLSPAALIASRPVLATLATAAAGQILETTNYTRDARGNLLSESRRLSDGTSSTTSYAYDLLGRLVSRTDAAGTADARTITQRYDARGNLTGELGGEGSAALAALGANPTAAAVDNVYATWGTVYIYDTAGRLVARNQANGVNAAGNRTIYFYRGDDLAVEANAVGDIVEYRYNARGERTDTILYSNRVAAATVAGAIGGQVTPDIQAMLNGYANAALDSVSHVDYNTIGAAKQSMDAVANTVTYDYNAFGELKTRTDPLDASTSVQTGRLYDRRGLLVSEKRDSAAGGLQLETLYGYDAFGRPTQVTDPSGRIRKTDYDRAGRVALTTDARNATQSFSYDGRGNVLTITDRNNATTTFTYDAFSRTTTTTTPGSITTTVRRNAHGQTISIKDGALRETVYTYDKDGNLKTETNAAANLIQHNYDAAGRLKETIDARGSKTSYSYDAVNRVLTEKVDDGDLNLVTAYEYDSRGRRFKVTDPANRVTLVEFDKNGRQTAVVVDSAGKALRTEYAYDKSGRLFTVTEGAGTAAVRITQYEYDKADRLLRTRVDPTGLNLLTQYSYDQAGNAARKTDAAGYLTTYQYDAENRLTRSLDAENGVVETFYDGEGRVIGTRQYANAGWAAAAAGGAYTLSVSADAARDHVSGYVYDADGRLRFTVDATGRPTEYLYDNSGNVLRSTDYAGTIAFAVGDSLATVQARIAAAGLAGSADTRITRAVYDAANRQAYAVDATGQVTAFGYDGSGNLIKQVRYANLFTTGGDPSVAAMQGWAASYAHADDRIDRTFYDGAGRATFSVDAENYVTQTQYDSASRVTKQIRHTSKTYSTGDGTSEAALAAQIGAPQASAAVTAFTYDSAGRLTDTTDPENSVTHLVLDALGQATDIIAAYNVAADSSTTHRVFDKAGRVQSETRAYGTAEYSTTSYIYDGMGRARYVTDARNVTTEYVYDGLGHCIHEIQPLNAGQTAHTYKEYDKFGNLVKLTDPRGNAALFHYDALDRLVWETDPEGYVTKTTYSRGDEVASVTRYALAVSGTTTAAPPAVTASSADATTAFARDKLDRLKSVTDAENKTETYTLNAFGDRISVTNRIDGTTNNTFDKRGLLVTETLPMASVTADGAVVATTVTNKFEYDSRGNRTKKIEAFGLAEARTTNWVYDKADRLIETRGDYVQVLDQASHNAISWVAPTETLKYDALNRVIEKTDALGARTLYYYDKMSRVKAEISPTGTYSAFTYDANGNLFIRQVYGTPVALPGVAGGAPPSPPAGEHRDTTYTYDSFNRLKTTSLSVTRPGAWNAALGQYDSPSWIYPTTTFEYDANGNLVQTVDGNGNSSFAYYDKLNRKIAEVDREGFLTYLTLDGEGNVLWDQRYATPLAGVTAASNPDALRAAAGEARTTEFVYDRNGRRRFEKRYGVQAYAVDPNSGALSGPAAAVATIEYSYNGLGEVVRKTEANGDYADYDYDQAGRLTRERRAGFVDNGGNWVRPTIDYSYDGLNALTRTRQGGEAAGGLDRVTRYYYGAGGRLGTMYDAGGSYFQYYYDAAGNVVRESYYRHRYAAGGAFEGVLYTRDQLGRVTSQGMASWNGSSWDRADTETTAYNAYGDVEKRGLNGLWQEQFFYDSAGRLWKTNSGDGVWRFFMYDGAGNRTLTMESEGADLSGYTFDQIVGLASSNYNTYIGNVYVDGLNVTIAQFDRRGLQVGTRLPFRQLAGSTMATLTGTRSYNAWGEATSETDTLGRTTNFLYNAMGRLIEKQSPWVDYTTESGATGNARPIERYYHDVSGRQIASEDANGNRIRRALIAGTGHGGSEALVSAEFHADGGVARTWYDVFGDARRLVNEVNEEETRLYDAMGRLSVQTHRGVTDYYGYDILGQRLTHWNTALGDSHFEITHHDVQGRVTCQITFGGDSTQTVYAWSSSLATAGMGNFGGWTETTTYANGKQLIEQSDRFGRALWKQDLGGHTFASYYDAAGRLIQRSGPETLYWSYYNTGLAYSVDSGTGNYAIYGYDAAGNKTQEYTVKAYAVVQNAAATYDELGRLKSWTEYGGAVAPASSTSYEYDLVGNIRHTHSVQAMLDVQGANIYAPTVDYWYRYDAMNRVTTDKGALSGGTISGGTNYTYDAAGRRKTSTTSVTRTAKLWKYQKGTFVRYATDYPYVYQDNGGGTFSYVDFAFTSAQVETYNYDGYGQLQSVAIAVQDLPYYDVWGTNNPQPGALGPAVTRAVYTHDGMGRMTAQSDYLADGYTVAYSRSVTYNAKGQITDETASTRQGTDTWTSVIHNEYGYGTAYALGAATVVTTSDSKNGYYQYGTTTTNSFAWWDGAVVSQVSFAKTSQPTYYTTYSYGSSGQLASIYVGDGRPRTITFTTDMLGQVIRRDEADNNYSGTYSGDPHEVWYRYNGRQIAYTGNNGTFDTDYAASIAARAKAPVGTNAFRYGDWNGPNIADYDPSLEHINSYSQGSAGGGYVVRAGDTLASVAQALWGDASLWYKLAEANGLSGAAALIEGRSLIVPHGVQANQHNASTFKPYDPAEVLGDSSPTTPKPQPQLQKKAGKCGMFGQILLVVIAVAVSVVTYGALAPHMAGFIGGVVAGAASGVAGSIASQAFGVATGIQDKFSWKGVAMAAVSGAVGGGLGRFAQLAQAGKIAGNLGKVGSFLGGGGGGFVSGAVRGAVSNIATQSIGVATGLQKKFDWLGVATAGIGGGVGNLVGGALHAQSLQSDRSMSNILANAGASAASAAANAGFRSLVQGTSFGDNLIAALPDVIGSTIGNLIAGAIQPDRPKDAANRSGEKAGPSGQNRAYDGDGIVGLGEMPSQEWRPLAGQSLTNLIPDKQLPALRRRFLDDVARLEPTSLAPPQAGSAASASAPPGDTQAEGNGVVMPFGHDPAYLGLLYYFGTQTRPDLFNDWATANNNDGTGLYNMLAGDLLNGGSGAAHLNNSLIALARQAEAGSDHALRIGASLLYNSDIWAVSNAFAAPKPSYLTSSVAERYGWNHYSWAMPSGRHDLSHGDGSSISSAPGGLRGWWNNAVGTAGYRASNAFTSFQSSHFSPLPYPLNVMMGAVNVVTEPFAGFIEGAARPLWPDRSDIFSEELRRRQVFGPQNSLLNPTNADRRRVFGLGVVAVVGGRAVPGLSAEAAVGTAEARLAGRTFDIGVNPSRYSLAAPGVSGFERVQGTIAARVGEVRFRAPPGATPEEIAQIQAYIAGSNDALRAGALSPTGRVSTQGALRFDASTAAAQERARATAAGVPYSGHAGHVPDTTWTGIPQPHSWLDLTPRVNTSLGGQARRYPIGYRPTRFVFE